MVSNVNIEEINRDITALQEKIVRCNKSKEDLISAIHKEKDTIQELDFYIREEKRNIEKPKFDIVSLEHNINRCKQNIITFNEVINRENASIDKFNYMIKILTEDLERPTEIIFDAKTGQVITK